jgi:putative DNA methylase
MAIFSRYTKVVSAEGNPLSVRHALGLINEALDEVLTHQEGDFDSSTRWAAAWFEQYGFGTGEYGVADTLSKAKNTSVSGMVEAGIALSKAGDVRLLRPQELPSVERLLKPAHLTDWGALHLIIRSLESSGETSAAEIAAKLGNRVEVARDLAYRLYAICERKKRSQEAVSYNAAVQSWPEILRLSREGGAPRKTQTGLFEESEE